jgi:tRNA(Ile)-lysidine synthase
MKTLIKKTFKENKKLLENHKRVLLAVSGGIDSMVLLQYFMELKDKFGLEEIGVVHINHKQREQSEIEEKYLVEYCNLYEIPIYVKPFPEGKEFSENIAREFRYNFFKEIMETYNYSALATAHHKDDQSETVFMRIIRGSRLLDLSGIKKKQFFHNGELIRPFLNVNKSEFPDIFHFEDSTNSENNYFRNRVRNIYIPELSRENKQFSNHLVNLADEVNSLNTVLKEFISDIDYLDLKTFKSYSKDTQLYFIQDYLSHYADANFSKGTVKDLLNILNSEKCYKQKIKDDFYIKKTNKYWNIYQLTTFKIE